MQRKVRINNGRDRVKEKEYKPGGSRENVGTRYSVNTLITDGVRRIFDDVAELEDYADGKTDYIGDVVTKSKPDRPFWFRLPRDQLTVLGEYHSNPKGNVEDVILGFRTPRFMFEPYNRFASIRPFDTARIGGSTQTRLDQVHAVRRSAGQVDRARFAPELEDIVVKALLGATVVRTEFIADDPSTMDAEEIAVWSGRPTTSDYSYGERMALYLSVAIHIAQDLSQFNFWPERAGETAYIQSVRRLVEFYKANQTVLDRFMTTKDADDLIGIYEMTAANAFADLPALRDFSVKYHEYASRYIERLGDQTGNTTLESEGQALSGNLSAKVDDFSPAREEIMWERIQNAKANGYLIVGMGDTHRENLASRLDADGIPHFRIDEELRRQKWRIRNKWVP